MSQRKDRFLQRCTPVVRPWVALPEPLTEAELDEIRCAPLKWHPKEPIEAWEKRKELIERAGAVEVSTEEVDDESEVDCSCSKCGESNLLLLKRIEQLIRQKRHLESLVDEEFYYGTPGGICYHRESCKWFQENKHAGYMRWRGHSAASKERKPCKTCRS